jgi:hypothetical protein
MEMHSCAASLFEYAIAMRLSCLKEVGVHQQERYWLIMQGSRSQIRREFAATAFLHSEVPIGDETKPALEIFTSQESAEAELRGMDRLAHDAYLDGVSGHGEELTNQMYKNTEPEKVVSLSRSELLSVLDSSGLMYVLVDPTPGDQPQPEHHPIQLAWELAEGLRNG